MDVTVLIKRLANSDIIRSETSLQMQLGLPILEKKHGSLCIRFFPHREEAKDGQYCFYAPQYEVSWVWPFTHVVLFRDFSIEKELPSEPACTISIEKMLLIGKSTYEIIFEECSRILTVYESTGSISDLAVKKYQDMLHGWLHQLGITDIYN